MRPALGSRWLSLETTSSRELSTPLASAGIRVSKEKAQHEISNVVFSTPMRITQAKRTGLTVLSLELGGISVGLQGGPLYQDPHGSVLENT